MIDKTLLQDSLETIVQCAQDLSADLDEPLFDKALPVAGRGLPAAAKERIARAYKSGHAAMEKQEKLVDLTKALKTFRQQHVLANGGLTSPTWKNAALVFSQSFGELYYYRFDFHSIERHQMLCSHTRLAEALMLHSTLDLTGPLNTYTIARKGDTLLPYTVDAPNPRMAVARLMALKAGHLTAWKNPVITQLIPCDETLFEEVAHDLFR